MLLLMIIKSHTNRLLYDFSINFNSTNHEFSSLKSGKNINRSLVRNKQVWIFFVMLLCITPEPGSPVFWCTVSYHYPWLRPASILQYRPQRNTQHMLSLRAQNVTQIHGHHVLPGYHFYGWVNQSPTWQHCSSRRLEPATLRLRVLRSNWLR